jgi:hypothetical protein
MIKAGEMTSLRPILSDKIPTNKMTKPAGTEKAVMIRPVWIWLKSRADLIFGNTGISMELPRTMTKGTLHNTAKGNTFSDFTAF